MEERGAASLQIERRAAAAVERMTVDFSLMFGAVRRKRPSSSKELGTAVEGNIQ